MPTLLWPKRQGHPEHNCGQGGTHAALRGLRTNGLEDPVQPCWPSHVLTLLRTCLPGGLGREVTPSITRPGLARVASLCVRGHVRD